MNKDKQEKRIWVIDYIKGISMIAVIFQHCELSGLHPLLLGYPFWMWLPVPILMMISGYTFSLSLSKHGSDIKRYYSLKSLVGKYSRYLVPVLPIYILRVVKNVIIDKEAFSPFKVIGNFFLAGNSGPGSYYVPCLLVLVLVFPLIYLLISRGGGTGLLILLLFNIMYDTVYSLTGLSYDVYRNIFFQYLFAVSCGCYIYLYGHKIKRVHLLVSGIIGAVYIFAVSYLNWSPAIIQNRAITAWPVSFWVLCFVGFVLIYHRNFRIPMELLHTGLVKIGQASYHIFCVQLLWFVSGIDRKLNMWISAPISIVVCCVVGYVYFVGGKEVRIKIFKGR